MAAEGTGRGVSGGFVERPKPARVNARPVPAEDDAAGVSTFQMWLEDCKVPYTVSGYAAAGTPVLEVGSAEGPIVLSDGSWVVLSDVGLEVLSAEAFDARYEPA